MPFPLPIFRLFALGLGAAFLPLLPALAADSAEKVLPRLSVREATVTECYDFIHQKTGLNIVLLPPVPEEARITVDLTNISALAAVRQIAGLAHLQTVEEAHAVVVSATAFRRPQIDLTPALQKADAIIVPQLNFRGATPVEAIAFLKQKQAGSLLRFEGPAAEEPRMDLSLTQVPLSDILFYVAALAHLTLKAEPGALVLRSPDAHESAADRLWAIERAERQQSRWPSAPPELAGSPLYQKAISLRVPKVELHETPLTEAIAYLNQQALAADPEKTGVKMVLQSGTDNQDVRISVSLTRLPLSEVLRYVSSLANMKVRAGADALLIIPNTVDLPTPESPESGAAPANR